MGLTDNIKKAQIAVTLLKDSAFTWYQTQGVTAAHGWLRLHNSMMRYFKPADYAFKTRLTLSKWTQHGSVINFIAEFSERYTIYADVDANEVLFYLLDGLEPSI